MVGRATKRKKLQRPRYTERKILQGPSFANGNAAPMAPSLATISVNGPTNGAEYFLDTHMNPSWDQALDFPGSTPLLESGLPDIDRIVAGLALPTGRLPVTEPDNLSQPLGPLLNISDLGTDPIQGDSRERIKPALSAVGNQDSHLPHILALGRSISLLDSHFLDATDTSIDKVMHVSKICLDEVAHLMQLDVYPACRSCKSLISTIVDLILGLYEKSLTPADSSSPNCANYPTIYVGVFPVEASDYSRIYPPIICRELRRLTQVIAKLSAGCCQPAGSDRSKQHQQIFRNLNHRVEALLSTQDDSIKFDQNA